MRIARLASAAALAATLTACATIASRIQSHQAAFDASPPEVQDKIRQGRVDVGFTPDQAEMALGHPQHVYERRTAAVTQTMWVYGLDFGPGTGAACGPHDGHIVVTDAFFEEHLRVIFENGRVAAIERRER